jgi:hypothetical protein
MAIEPMAVITQDRSEIAPTLAMLVGSMMMPEPIMFTATMTVSCMTFIFFLSCCWARMEPFSRIRASSGHVHRAGAAPSWTRSLWSQ